MKKSVGLTLEAKAELEQTANGFRGRVEADAEAFNLESTINDSGEEEK